MKKTPRPACVNPLTVSVAQNWCNQHTVTVNRERRVREFELMETENAILALQHALNEQQRKARDLRATIEGLTLVVERR